MPGSEFIGAEERKEVLDVLESGILFRYGYDNQRNNHWKAFELEAEVRKFTGAPFAHAVSSGSTAVSTAMASAGIGYGDEVIVTPFTYIATIEAIFLAGAIPVFADIDETLCLSAEGIQKALTPNTKGICLVHMCGASADMDSIMPLVEANNLTLVEDAGQALGAFFKGKSVGLFGVSGAYSFDFFKITTAGEGGVCVANDEKVYHTMTQFSDHGHTHIGDNRGMEQHPIMGTNFRISELNAAIGKAQMQRIGYVRDKNLKNKAHIRRAIEDIDGITFRNMTDPSGDSGTFLNFFLPTQELAEKVVSRLAKEGLGGFNYWYRNMYHFINQWEHVKNMSVPMTIVAQKLGTPQDYNKLDLPGAQNVIGRLISLGIRANWPENELNEFSEKLRAILKSTV
ncbi:MAG TPA: L-glutamine--2-deoxy-scyllo-inosose aminotransferase KanB [Flavobacteriales bacterium]|jgi:8-amino-3,8-dideoxy-alpha-D-manno-octulosonate transaminase|nr:L-glutamine--2-deoxy-scyllo-inosose aminotransferase KanB [Flavobacteriales bacterium]